VTTAASPLTVVEVPIDDLRPDPANPRRISDTQVEALTRSIQEYGFVQPVLARSADKTVIGGHQRLTAARRLGYKTVPVSFLDITLEQARLLNLGLNKISGDWDQELLARLLADLSTEEVDLSLSGFADDEVSKLLKSLEHRERRERVESFELDAALEAARAAPRAQRGELWALGDHRLLCGDACNTADVSRLFDGKQAAMCFTDPPYNVSLGDHGGQQRGARKRRIQNDSMPADEWEAFCRRWSRNLLSCVDGAIYVCMSTKEWPLVSRVLEGEGAHWSDTIIWAKDRFVLGGPTTSGSTSRSGTAGVRGPSITGTAIVTRGMCGASSGPQPPSCIRRPSLLRWSSEPSRTAPSLVTWSAIYSSARAPR
jgi:hypothetical protein